MTYAAFIVGNFPGSGESLESAVANRRRDFEYSPESRWSKRINLYPGNSEQVYHDHISGEIFAPIILADKLLAEDCILFVFVAPGNVLPSISLQTKAKVCAVVGDVHHVINPFTFLLNALSAIQPTSVLFISSIFGGDIICRLLGINYSLWPYTLRSAYAVEEPHPRHFEAIVLFGDILSPFHPRRSVAYAKIQSAWRCIDGEIIKHPFVDFFSWANSIRPEFLQVHCSLSGNLSHHPVFAMTRGCVTVLDSDLISNPYFSTVFNDRVSCISFESIIEYMECTSRWEFVVTLTKNIGSVGRELIRDLSFFDRELSAEILDSYPVNVFNKVIARESSRLDGYLELVTAIVRLSRSEVALLMDCLQELSRISCRSLKIGSLGSDQIGMILPLVARNSRFQVVSAWQDQEDLDILLSSDIMNSQITIKNRHFKSLRETMTVEILRRFATDAGAPEHIRLWPQSTPTCVKIFLRAEFLP